MGVFALTCARAESSRVPESCRKKVRDLIQSTAARMGESRRFELQLVERPPRGSFYEFDSGAFIVDDGYISNASAVVTVEMPTCRLVKISLTLGE